MPVSAMVDVARMLDADWRCPLGDEAAQRFGRTQAVFVRSSASHVFVTDAGMPHQRLVLRMRRTAEEDVLHRSAVVAAALAEADAPVAPPQRSTGGELVERVAGFAVTAMIAVEGETVESESIDDDAAHRWGALLAELHACARLARVEAEANADERRGLLHGDPELDNVIWAADGPVFVDLDDVHTGWYAADVAFALRDWAPPAAAPDLAHGVPKAFLEGYRSRRRLTDEETAWLPRMARTHAEGTLRRLAPALAEDAQPDWPEWALQLHQRVGTSAATLRAALR